MTSQAAVLNVLYGEPADPAAFEAYYAATHLPLVARIAGIERAVLIRGLPNADGSKPAYYRLAQLFFAGPEQMERSLGSAEGQAAVADLAQFATGGVTVVVGEVG
ncbi:EthD family reductase [Novosphingobium piscinae]|uniref:EthD family reductase n=1 Tax=Novosphingobium piscinae TaxID=1507448 RepID=A0A7X1KQU9_9SPHN|nr:EthD family reductase [Novosphingobium piscinae]MBC2670092.1 EthD family reductase [Novosphingobium piscinae]